MGSLIGWLVERGLGERAARWIALGGLGLVLGLVMAGMKCAYDRDLIRAHESDRTARIERQAAPAADRAAEARANDIIAIDREREQRRDLIDSAPESAPSPAAVALACRRLRRAGADVADHPACRRP